ncbi:MAG: hypothetical protein AMXMBFR33_26540 [Candidatus Xenobia bacterium]
MSVRVLVMVFFLALALPGLAQEVTLGDRVVMRLESAEQAEAVSRRIEAQLERGADPEGIKVVKSKNGATILWGGVLIVEVTRSMAAANQSDPLKLALRWANNLHELVADGLVRLSPGRVVMPVGEARTIEVTGLAEGPIEVEDANGVVQAAVDETGLLTLTGSRVGKTRLKVRRGQGQAYLFVHVKDWAGTLPEVVNVQVVGNPAPGAVVAEGVLREAYVQARVRPGCVMSVGGDLSELPSVPRGQMMRLTVPIKIEGSEDYYPVARSLPVVVSSLDVEPVEANLLLVSNRPELVDVDGVLLQYKFSQKEPSRLMYSHKNISKGKRNLWVNLENPNDQAVKVLVNTLYAGPSRNEVLVGHTSATRFLEQEGDGAGYVLTMPPRTKLELAAHEVGTQALVTGFANLRILEGESLEVEVRTELAPSFNDGKKLPHLGAPFNPFKIHPHGVFAQPYFEEELEFRTGGAPVGVRFGEDPWLIDFETGLPNTGNFGVFYRLETTLINPRPFPVRVGLYFLPLNGPAAGSFLIDGKVYETPFRKPQGAPPSLVRHFDLGPGEKKVVRLLTFPEASSSYPAELQWHDVTGQGEPTTSGPLQVPGGTEWK